MQVTPHTHIYRCGNLTIDPQTGEIRNQTDSLRLSPVNMQVLVSLLEFQGRVITRAELFDQVWKNQIISDDTLTRCISDLRAQLRKFSDIGTLIETLPKRGYRWVPEVCKEIPISKAIPQINLSKDTRWKSRFGWGLIVLGFLFTLSTSVLWMANTYKQTQKIQVALIPIKTIHQQSMANELGDILRTHLLANRKLSFLSETAIENRPHNPFPYLTREFGTQWLIEGNIRKHNDAFKVTLSLVDAKTALVSHTQSEELDGNNQSLEKFSITFLKEIVLILRLEEE